MSNDSTCFRYNFALVSNVAKSFAESSSYDLVSPNLKIDIDQARREHEELVDALRRIGVDVIELPCDERQPDGLFVDDVAIVINKTALICNPPTFKDRPPRREETAVVRQVLRKELGLKIVEVDTEEAQVEGGDVLFTGREIFVGLSTRTNMLGAQAVSKAFPEYSTTIVNVHPPAVHLKDYISMAGPEVMVIGSSAGAQKTYQEILNSGAIGYKYITVEEDEAANVISANGFLLHLSPDQIPRGSMVYTNKIEYSKVGIRMVEPLKRGGRLSSCVLLVNRVKKIPTTAQYNFALVSRVANSFAESSSYDLVSPNLKIDIDQARREHEELVDALRRIGVDVIELPCDERQPDGLFVDDVAIVINMTALICNPPTFKDRPPRHGELAVVRQVLRKEIGLKIVEVDTEKAQVEGGDVLFTGREIFVGLSTRTNMLGAQAVGKAFPEYSTTIVKVHPPAVHLKDYISMAGPEVMAIGSSVGAQKTFQEIRNSGAIGYKYITVEEDEAANVIYANGFLLHLSPDQIPRGSMVYTNKIEYSKVGIRMVEPLKRGGRLSSCVLLVNRVKLPKKIPTTAQ